MIATFQQIRKRFHSESASILAQILAVDRLPCAINPFRKLQGIGFPNLPRLYHSSRLVEFGLGTLTRQASDTQGHNPLLLPNIAIYYCKLVPITGSEGPIVA